MVSQDNPRLALAAGLEKLAHDLMDGFRRFCD